MNGVTVLLCTVLMCRASRSLWMEACAGIAMLRELHVELQDRVSGVLHLISSTNLRVFNYGLGVGINGAGANAG